MLNCWHNIKSCSYKDGYECKLKSGGACQFDILENKLWESGRSEDKVEAIREAENEFRLKQTEAGMRR